MKVRAPLGFADLIGAASGDRLHHGMTAGLCPLRAPPLARGLRGARARAPAAPRPPPPAAIRFETDQATGDFNGIIHEDTFMPAAELGYFHMMPRFEHGYRVAGLRDATRWEDALAAFKEAAEKGEPDEPANE